jgi:rod shape-determining protein MreD
MSFRIQPRSDPWGAPLVPMPDAPPWWMTGLALLVALLLQTQTGPWLALRGAAPGFVFLFVLWYGLRTDMLGGFLVGMLAGACEDALAGWTGAAWMFATAITGALAGRTAGTVVSESRVWLVPYAALATLFRYALFALALRVEGHALPVPVAHLHQVLWQAALDALLAYLALTFLPRLRVSRVGLR